MPPPQTRPHGVRPMDRTPIYDQLRGERINADVPAAEADPQVVGRRGRHHVLVVAPGQAAVVGPPGPSPGLDRNRHHLQETYPAVQPAGAGGRAVSASHNPAAQGTAAGDHDAHWDRGADRDRYSTLN